MVLKGFYDLIDLKILLNSLKGIGNVNFVVCKKTVYNGYDIIYKKIEIRLILTVGNIVLQALQN